MAIYRNDIDVEKKVADIAMKLKELKENNQFFLKEDIIKIITPEDLLSLLNEVAMTHEVIDLESVDGVCKALYDFSHKDKDFLPTAEDQAKKTLYLTALCKVDPVLIEALNLLLEDEVFMAYYSMNFDMLKGYSFLEKMYEKYTNYYGSSNVIAREILNFEQVIEEKVEAEKLVEKLGELIKDK